MSSYTAGVVAANDEIGVDDLLAILRRRRRSIGVSVIATALVTTAAVFLIPPEYRAEAVILTPQQAQTSLGAMAQAAGAGAGLPGLSLLAGFGVRTQTDLYIGILESRTIGDSLIGKFDLKRAYGTRDMQATRKRLARNTTIKTGRDTLIRIRVQDRNATLAAELANAYVDELGRQNSSVALTEASQRRLFFQDQLSKEKDALADAEIALRNTQQSTGLVAPVGQPEALIRAVAQLNAEILTREAQVEAMKTYAAEENPSYQVAKRQLNTLQAKLKSLQFGNRLSGPTDVPLGQLPQAGLEYLRRYRTMKYHETLFEVLSKQYEAARLDEARSSGLIQVIDRAVVPERKSWPPRTAIILVACGGAALISGGWWLWKDSAGKIAT